MRDKSKMSVQKLSLAIYVTFTLLLNVGYSSKNKSNFRDLQMSDGCFCKVNILYNTMYNIQLTVVGSAVMSLNCVTVN